MSPSVRTLARAGWALVLLGAILPGAARAQATADSVDRSRPPALVPPRPLHLPAVHRETLGNGLELDVVEMHRVPVVDVTLLVRAGAVRDSSDLPGLATFVAGMLDEGAGARSALAIADEVDYLGANLSTNAGLENATVRLHCTKARLPKALDLMADVALRPAFADSEITRQRELRKTALLQMRDQPNAIAPLAFAAIVFGEEHPYGRPQQGTEASTAALDREKVVGFYDTYYRPNNAAMLVVGDVTPAEARRLIETRFGAWAQGPVSLPPVAEPVPPRPRSFYLVDKPGSAQSVILLGNVGVARSTPDYYALRVLNTILGGSFTSRLNQNLRETHGYTYGARSAFDMYRLAGPFRATAAVQTAKTDSSLIEFLKELRRIRNDEVPPEELAKAKAYLALGLPSEFETTQGASGMFLELLANGLPLDSYDTFIARVSAVTAGDVQRVARQYIQPDSFDVIVVGDRSQIEGPIRSLNEGPIELRDMWGKPVQ
ncbi:MAG TPA: pitrilysin family protein [Terriglobales bacterium]|nr:pitrilysin family protein [Terriglobales bacterium]